MKRILIMLMVLASIKSFAQPVPRHTRINQSYQWPSGVFDSTLANPVRDTTVNAVRIGEQRFRVQDSSIYVAVCTSACGGPKWKKVGTGTGGSDGNNYVADADFVDSILTIERNGLPDVTVKIKPRVDTSDVVNILKAGVVANMDSLKATRLFENGIRRVWTQGYYSPGDGGDARYIYVDTSTKTPDDKFIILPAGKTTATAGRWELMIENQSLNLLQIGARITPNIIFAGTSGAFDNYDVIMSALRFWDNYKWFSEIIIPGLGSTLDGLFVGRKLQIHQQIRIKGQIPGVVSDRKAKLIFTNTAGLEFLYPNPGDVVSYSGRYYQALQKHSLGNAPTGTASDNDYWEDLGTSYANLSSVYSDTVTYYGNSYGAEEAWVEDLVIRNIPFPFSNYLSDSTLTGVFSNNRLHMRRCYVIGFQGDGIWRHGNVADVPYATNASGWTSQDNFVQFNAGYGMKITGGDINTFVSINDKFTSNKYAGILDSSLLGGVIIKPDCHNNGIYGAGGATNSSGYVSYNGLYYAARKNSVNQAPTGLPTDNEYWTYYSASDLWGTSVPWTSSTHHRAIGGVMVLRGFTKVSAPYLEDGGFHTIVGGTGSMMDGGYSIGTPVLGAWLQGSWNLSTHPYGTFASGFEGKGAFRARRFEWQGGSFEDDNQGGVMLKSTNLPYVHSTNGLSYYLGPTNPYAFAMNSDGNFAFGDHGGINNAWKVSIIGNLRVTGSDVRFSGLNRALLDSAGYKLTAVDADGDMVKIDWPTFGSDEDFGNYYYENWVDPDSAFFAPSDSVLKSRMYKVAAANSKLTVTPTRTDSTTLWTVGVNEANFTGIPQSAVTGMSDSLAAHRARLVDLEASSGGSTPGIDDVLAQGQTLTATRSLSGGTYSLNLGTGGSKLSNLTVNASGYFQLYGGFQLDRGVATDANYTANAYSPMIVLPTITANRTLTLPSAGAGKKIEIQNNNATSFQWQVSGVKDITGATIFAIPNQFIGYLINDGTDWIINNSGKTVEHMVIAVSDETTAITTGTAKVTFRMPYSATITGVRASVNTVSSSGTPTIDINESGTTILSTKLTIDANEKTSTTAASAAVISDSSIADDAEITIDIDVAGTGAKGLKIIIYYTR